MQAYLYVQLSGRVIEWAHSWPLGFIWPYFCSKFRSGCCGYSPIQFWNIYKGGDSVACLG